MRYGSLALLVFLSVAVVETALAGSKGKEDATGWVTREVAYTLDGVEFLSTAVWDPKAAKNGALPGVLMVPNWLGPTEASLDKAKSVAKAGYVVLMVDMYGVEVRPKNGQEAGAAAGTVRGDREMMRARAAEAHEQFVAMEDVPLDPEKMAAIGFCFGGGTVLEYARSGVDLDAVVSFHGDLLSPTLEADSAEVKSRVLVLHGADDPFVPQAHVQQFVDVMQSTDADWQLVQFSNTVHNFTDPFAAMPNAAEYQPVSAKRAFEMMEDLFAEVFEAD